MAKKRFTHVDLPPIGQVTAGPGKEYETVFDVPEPVGQKWASLTFDVIDAAFKMQETVSDSTDDPRKVLNAIREVVGERQFYDVLLPACLGIDDDPQAIEFLKNHFTPMEVFNAFGEASALISDRAFGSEETRAALKKSNGAQPLDGQEDEAAA